MSQAQTYTTRQNLAHLQLYMPRIDIDVAIVFVEILETMNAIVF